MKRVNLGGSSVITTRTAQEVIGAGSRKGRLSVPEPRRSDRRQHQLLTLCPLGHPEKAIGHESQIEPWVTHARRIRYCLMAFSEIDGISFHSGFRTAEQTLRAPIGAAWVTLSGSENTQFPRGKRKSTADFRPALVSPATGSQRARKKMRMTHGAQNTRGPSREKRGGTCAKPRIGKARGRG
jgi:hypothetical protein